MLSISEHLHERFMHVQNGPAEERLQRLHELEPWTCETDAYLTFTGPISAGHLPSVDWNAQLRKSYTLLCWVRPRIVEEKETNSTVPDQPNPETASETTPPSPLRPKIFYRFSTSPDDSEATGISVTCSDWKIVVPEENDKDDKEKYLETILTATALPSDVRLQIPLRLKSNVWQLIGFSHVFPYLKRPTLTVTYQGQAIGTGELAYPQPDVSVMESNTCFQNIVSPGMQLDVACLTLYPSVIGSTIQALCAEAGPNVALQTGDGRILPTLPPICNWYVVAKNINVKLSSLLTFRKTSSN